MKPSRQAAYEIAKQCTHANTHILDERGINVSNEPANFVQMWFDGETVNACFDCNDKAHAAEKSAKKLDPKVKREKRQMIISSDYMAMMQFSGAMRRKQ